SSRADGADMSDDLARGTLLDPAAAPTTGEATHEVVRIDGVVVEQILSGRLDAPRDYCEPVDEWVVVLAGRAELEVGGGTVVLASGDWLLLPANTPHRLARTDPGTNWLTVTGRTLTPPAS